MARNLCVYWLGAGLVLIFSGGAAASPGARGGHLAWVVAALTGVAAVTVAVGGYGLVAGSRRWGDAAAKMPPVPRSTLVVLALYALSLLPAGAMWTVAYGACVGLNARWQLGLPAVAVGCWGGAEILVSSAVLAAASGVMLRQR
jgi:hypothetical protein